MTSLANLIVELPDTHWRLCAACMMQTRQVLAGPGLFVAGALLYLATVAAAAQTGSLHRILKALCQWHLTDMVRVCGQCHTVTTICECCHHTLLHRKWSASFYVSAVYTCGYR